MRCFIYSWIVAGLMPVAAFGAVYENHKDQPPVSVGTHVGNGAPDEQEQELEKMKKILGGEVNVRTASIDDIRAWCGRVSSVLQDQYARAQMLYRKNKLELGNQVLTDALIAVNSSMGQSSNLSGPMIKNLAARGVMIIRALDDKLPPEERLTLVTKAHFLTQYVEFILETERRLETPYYPYYRYSSREREREQNSSLDLRDMERRYLEVAERQLRFIKQFAERTNGVVTPIGAPRAFLKLSEMICAFVADDLSDNLYAAANACNIVALDKVGRMLYANNNHGSGDIVEVTTYAYNEILRVADKIENKESCK